MHTEPVPNTYASALALASDQPLPDQGPGLGELTLISDVLVLGLTIALVAALARLLGQPDLTAWLEAVGIVVFLKGLVELGLTWRAFHRKGLHPSYHQTLWRWSQ